jgi:hypothetical protein
MLPAGMTLDQVLENPTAGVTKSLEMGQYGMLLGFFISGIGLSPLIWPYQRIFSRFYQKQPLVVVRPIILIFLSGVADILGAFDGWIMDQLQMQSLDDMQNGANQLQTIMLRSTSGVQWLSAVIAVS